MTDKPKTVTLPMEWRPRLNRPDTQHTLFVADIPYASIYKLMRDTSWIIGGFSKTKYDSADAAKAALEAAVLAMGVQIAVEDEKEKPPMPAHDYAEQWARDTMSGMADGSKLPWGERNLAQCYIDKLKNPWTWVQDELPKIGVPVILTVYYGGRYSERACLIYESGTVKWVTIHTGREIPDDCVIAWMPEPTPYEGD